MTALSEDNSTADLPAGIVLRVRGRAGTADVVNGNRHLYPASVYRRVVRSFNARSQTDETLGELDHSFNGSLSDTALRITRMHLAEGRHLDFAADVLDTHAGRNLKAMIQAGVTVNVSTAGLGSLMACCKEHAEQLWAPDEPTAATGGEHQPHYGVCDDYELRRIDAVSRGAARSAHLAAESEAAHTQGVTQGDTMRITEQDGDLSAQVASLQAQLSQARSDLGVLQGAVSEERTTLQADLETTRSQSAAELATRDTRISELESHLAQAEAGRDEALATLRRAEVTAQAAVLTSSLRPDIRTRVEAELNACDSLEAVTERWESLQNLLAGAGITPTPTGSGRVHSESDASEGAGTHIKPETGTLSPAQRVQRALLGLS